MERIAHRDLRNDSAEILRRVAAGESFEITNHGAVVAVIAPPTEAPTRLRVARAAVGDGTWADLAPATVKGRPTEEVLDDLRDERT